MSARFFVDETDLKLGKALAEEHGNVVFPGHPDLPEVPRGTLDDDWLPVIGARWLVVITRDQRIRYRAGEKRAWVDHKVRGLVLTGKRSQTTTESRAILIGHWSTIEAIVDDEPEGPWMRAVTESGLRLICPHVTKRQGGPRRLALRSGALDSDLDDYNRVETPPGRIDLMARIKFYELRAQVDACPGLSRAARRQARRNP